MNDDIYVARHHAEVLANCIGQLVDDRLPEYLIEMCNDVVEELLKFCFTVHNTTPPHL